MDQADISKESEQPHPARSESVGEIQYRYGKIRLVAEKIMLTIFRSIFFPEKLRPSALRLLGAKVGRDVSIKQGVFFGQPRNLIIEDGVFINIGTFIDCSAPVRIGEKVRIGYQAMILTGTHNIENSVYRQMEGNHVRRPVVIGRGCWIQARASIMPGVIMGEGCVVFACSVLTKSTNPDGQYSGVPAKRLKDLPRTDDA